MCTDKRHVPRYPTRFKHCMTTLSNALIFGKFTEISENVGKASKLFLKSFDDF